MSKSPSDYRHVVDLVGPWQLYTPRCPAGWTMLGTITRGPDVAALALAPAGIYRALSNGVSRSLDQRKVKAALEAANGD